MCVCDVTASSHSKGDNVGAGERRERPGSRGEGSTSRGGATDTAGDALSGPTHRHATLSNSTGICSVNISA